MPIVGKIWSNHDPKATFLWFPPNGRRAMCDFSSCNGLELTCRHDMEQLKLKTQQRGNYSFIKICSSPMLEHFKIIFKNPILIYFVPSNFTPYPSVIITLLVRHNFYVYIYNIYIYIIVYLSYSLIYIMID